MSLLISQIEKIVAELEDSEIFLIETVIGGSSKVPKITVTIDADKGVTIQQCTSVTRKLNKYLIEEVYPDGSYALEVSSPGADKPIAVNRQYVKNIGRKLKVALNDGNELEGELKEVSEEGILITHEKVEKVNNKKVRTSFEERISYSEIKKANVIITI